jgi:hypothetical protein
LVVANLNPFGVCPLAPFLASHPPVVYYYQNIGANGSMGRLFLEEDMKRLCPILPLQTLSHINP